MKNNRRQVNDSIIHSPIPLRQKELQYSGEEPFVTFKGFFHDFTHINLHYHHALEINICCNLRGKAFINNNSYDLKDNPIIIIPPKTLHSYEIEGSEGHMLIMMISMNSFYQYIDMKNIQKLLNFDSLPYVSNEYKGLERYVQECLHSNDGKIIENISIFFNIMNIINNVAPCTKQNSSALDKKIEQVIIYTENNLQNEMSLDEISKTVNFSREYFCRYFKSKTGSTYIKYLLQTRLNHAKKLLNLNSSVSDACFQSGFNNLSYFIKAFKDYNNGITPRVFKQNHK